MYDPPDGRLMRLNEYLQCTVSVYIHVHVQVYERIVEFLDITGTCGAARRRQVTAPPILGIRFSRSTATRVCPVARSVTFLHNHITYRTFITVEPCLLQCNSFLILRSTLCNYDSYFNFFLLARSQSKKAFHFLR